MSIPDPAIGLMVWDTTYNGIWGFDGAQWNELSSKWGRNADDIYNRNAENVGIGITNPHYKLALDGIFAIYSGDRFIGSIRGYQDNCVINAKLGSLFNESNPQHLILQYDFDDFLSTSGRVGIGVSAPKAKLHVDKDVMIGEGDPAYGYALSVNGKIMATEMRIESYGAWPDYVFEPDYALNSLDDLSSQIASAGHLPGIPSADEIEKNGLLVGDMQKRQMEKIEELTLYILQLHDRISVLEKQIIEGKGQSVISSSQQTHK